MTIKFCYHIKFTFQFPKFPRKGNKNRTSVEDDFHFKSILVNLWNNVLTPYAYKQTYKNRETCGFERKMLLVIMYQFSLGEDIGIGRRRRLK